MIVNYFYIDGAIKASYANFGYIPYGHSIVRDIVNLTNLKYRLVVCIMMKKIQRHVLT